MKCHRAFLSLVSTLGMLCMLVAAPGALASLPQTPQEIQATPEGLTATVHSVDAKANTLDVITGVGHALRLVRVQVGPQCQIRVAGTLAKLDDVKAGSIVRIQYRKTPGGMLADKIETVAGEEMEDKR